MRRLVEAVENELGAGTDEALQGLFDAAADHGDGPAGVEQVMTAMPAGYRTHPRVLRALAEVPCYDEEAGAYRLGEVGAFVATEQRRLEQEQRARTSAARTPPVSAEDHRKEADPESRSPA